MTFSERLAAARNAPTRWHSCTVILGGEAVSVEVSRLPGREWVELVERRAPRDSHRGDHARGYDRDAVVRDYPPHACKIAEATPSADEWRNFVGALDSVWRSAVTDAIWWLNVGQPTARIANARAQANPTAS